MTEGMHLDDHGMEQTVPSRRKFLASSAAMLAGGALLAVPGVAKAHTTARNVTDVDILNYALTLERLEKEFYRRVLDRFNEREFENAKIFDGLGDYIRSRAYGYFQLISEHEDTHVKALVATIKELGGERAPVPVASYSFGIKTVGDAVQIAKVLENTGVGAYDGAIAHIQRAEYLTVASTIATVEARHAAYLNLLNRTRPFPSVFDNPVAPRTICETVNRAFITDAPEPYGPYRSLGMFCAMLPDTVN